MKSLKDYMKLPYNYIVQPIEDESGKYYYDLDVKEVSTSTADGTRKFFATILAEK